MTAPLDSHTALALLDWQIDLGATEAIGDTPVNRYDSPEKLAPVAKPTAPPPIPAQTPNVDAVAEAAGAANTADTLAALKSALAAFDHCQLKRGARNLVFSDGHPTARVMIIGEAPGRDEDLEGRPFVGRAGQLLDKMLAAIGLDRQSDAPQTGTYITNVSPWRPPQNRDPDPQEIAMLLPFVERHVQLADPDVVVLMGNISCQAALGKRGITKLRGTWTEAFGKPALPMCHPAYLLRNPAAKREAWADLLDLQARLEGTS